MTLNDGRAVHRLETIALGELSLAHLRLAVGDCIIRPQPLSLDETIAALWREDPTVVGRVFDAMTSNRADHREEPTGRHGLLAATMRELRRPPPKIDQRGLQINDIATQAGIARETLCALLEHHGYLELVFHGGRQRRRLVTQQAIDAGFGQNIDPSGVRLALEGAAKVAAFPVFFLEWVPKILWTLDYARLREHANAIPSKRVRLHWLLMQHAYLPRKELAALSGYSERGWSKAVRSSFISYKGTSSATSERTKLRTESESGAHEGILHDLALPAPEPARSLEGANRRELLHDHH